MIFFDQTRWNTSFVREKSFSFMFLLIFLCMSMYVNERSDAAERMRFFVFVYSLFWRTISIHWSAKKIKQFCSIFYHHEKNETWKLLCLSAVLCMQCLCACYSWKGKIISCVLSTNIVFVELKRFWKKLVTFLIFILNNGRFVDIDVL